MSEICLHCQKEVTHLQYITGCAVKTIHDLYVHTGCIDSQRKGYAMTRQCQFCGEVLVVPEFETGLAIKTGRDRYAHVGCIDSHGKENTVAEKTQHILGAADSAHQGIDLAISLLQESLANMGEILTRGCACLGTASLGSTMRVGQTIKNMCFRLKDLQVDAHGLCILLGNDLGILDGESESEVNVLSMPPDRDSFHERMFGNTDDDLAPGEDEFDDDEQPF